MELHLKYRPKVLKDLLGQPEAVKTLQGFLKNGGLPHALLLSGPSGVGKTSVARILVSKLDCSERDFCEINAASSRNIDTVREIQQMMGLAPMGGKSRIYLFDECFSPNELVDTPSGPRVISSIARGDTVHTIDGPSKVVRSFRNVVKLDRITKVTFGNGTVVYTTVDHLFLTENGWKEAGNLCFSSLWRYNYMDEHITPRGNHDEEKMRLLRPEIYRNEVRQEKVLFKELRPEAQKSADWLRQNGRETLRRVWREIRGENITKKQNLLFRDVCRDSFFSVESRQEDTKGGERVRGVRCCYVGNSTLQEKILFKILWGKMEDPSVRVSRETIQRGGSKENQSGKKEVFQDPRGKETGKRKFAEDGGEKSFTRFEDCSEDQRDQESKRYTTRLAGTPGRERTVYSRATESMGKLRGTEWGLGLGLSSANWTQSQRRFWFSHMLQSGFGERSGKTSRRGRWKRSSVEEKYHSRCQKDQKAERVGVVRVEVYQPGSNDQSFVGVIGDREKAQGFVIFYDLQINGHPSYFVRGIPVHNCHELSKRHGGNAQSALLKVLEEAPSHVYFILATTEPEGLLRTIRTRCSEVKFKAISPSDLEGLLRGVVDKERMEVSDAVLEQIIESCQGSARQALKFLEQVVGIEDDEDRINVILSTDSKRQGIEIARALMDPRSSWAQVSSMIKNVVEEPETVRHIILTYTSSYLLNLKGGAKANNAYLILTAFEANFFDSKKSGLVRAAWEVMASRTRK